METIYSAYQHQSKGFKPEKLKQYRLRLMMRPNLMQYAVIGDNGKIMALKEYRSKTTLDPAGFFDAVYAKDYFLKEDYQDLSNSL